MILFRFFVCFCCFFFFQKLCIGRNFLRGLGPYKACVSTGIVRKMAFQTRFQFLYIVKCGWKDSRVIWHPVRVTCQGLEGRNAGGTCQGDESDQILREEGSRWKHRERKERPAPETPRQRMRVKNKTGLMIKLRAPRQGGKWKGQLCS